MDNTKYIGMDVHKEAIAIAVLNAAGKLVMESIIETKANTILDRSGFSFRAYFSAVCRLKRIPPATRRMWNPTWEVSS
jgi:hypothetical protein